MINSAGNAYKGFPSGIGYSDIKNGLLFSGGNFAVTSLTATGCYNWAITALHRHSKANNYVANRTLFIPNSNCTNYSSEGGSSKKLFYSEVDQFVYYASTNHDAPGALNLCDTIQNDIQIVCVDTNLNLRWKKFISPKKDRCIRIAQVLQPVGGSGLTITGYYLDAQTPSDKTLQGGFIIHVDSTGVLDVGSQPNFTIRDRFTVYPNPAKNGFWLEDATGIPSKAFVYDLAGQPIASYTLTGRKNWLELPTGKAGMFLLRVIPEWGEGYSQMVQIAE